MLGEQPVYELGQLRIGGAERLGVREADPLHHVPVPPAGRQAQRPPGRDAQQPPLGVEQVKQPEEVVLVRRAPVHQHERALGLARRGAYAVDHALVARGFSSGVTVASIFSRIGSNFGGSTSFSPRCSGSSSASKPGPSVAISNSTPLGSRK